MVNSGLSAVSQSHIFLTYQSPLEAREFEVGIPYKHAKRYLYIIGNNGNHHQKIAISR